MTYQTTLFPDCISRGARGGPWWESDSVYSGGGQRYTNQHVAQALRRYDVSHAARKKAFYAQLLAFWHSVRGPMHSFPFKDWSDYTCPDNAGVGKFAHVADDTAGNMFQMVKRYTFGNLSHDRVILKPVSGTVTVTGGSSPTVDYTTGIVTVASGTPTSWTGQFYVPCCFDLDQMDGEIIDGTDARRIEGWSGIKLVETRNP